MMRLTLALVAIVLAMDLAVAGTTAHTAATLDGSLWDAIAAALPH